ncbi:hypothetical protein D3C76_1877610 [compost metagenome]
MIVCFFCGGSRSKGMDFGSVGGNAPPSPIRIEVPLVEHAVMPIRIANRSATLHLNMVSSQAVC